MNFTAYQTFHPQRLKKNHVCRLPCLNYGQIWWKYNTSVSEIFQIIFNWMARSSWRHQIETFSALLAICAGNSVVTGELPAQRPVTPSFDVFFDLRLNRRPSKQWWCWWIETLSRPLWRHSYDLTDDQSIKLQIRAWGRQAQNPLPDQWLPWSVSPCGVISPLWFNLNSVNLNRCHSLTYVMRETKFDQTPFPYFEKVEYRDNSDIRYRPPAAH